MAFVILHASSTGAPGPDDVTVNVDEATFDEVANGDADQVTFQGSVPDYHPIKKSYGCITANNCPDELRNVAVVLPTKSDAGKFRVRITATRHRRM